VTLAHRTRPSTTIVRLADLEILEASETTGVLVRYDGQVYRGVPRAGLDAVPDSAPDGSLWLQSDGADWPSFTMLSPYVPQVVRTPRRRGDGPVDVLDAFPVLTPRRDPSMPPRGYEAAALQGSRDTMFSTVTPHVGRTTERPPIRGRAILDFLRAKGLTFVLSESRVDFRVVWPQKKIDLYLAPVIEVIEPLLLGWLADLPVACDAGPHDEPTEAVTLLWPHNPACAEHAGISVPEPEPEPKPKPGIVARLKGAA
jgi:hypothetical protein